MVNYGNLSDLQRMIMGFFCVLSNLLGIPLAKRLSNHKNLRFEAIIILMVVVTSGMYHLSEVLNCSLILEELEWHRLDNIFSISALSVFIMHLLGNSMIRQPIYFTLVVAIITQMIDPWNLAYTITPIICFALLSLYIRIKTDKDYIRNYQTTNAIITLVFSIISFYFFYFGLDQLDDYLRFNHSMWHTFGTIFTYYGFFVVKVTPNLPQKFKMDDIQQNTGLNKSVYE